MSTLDRKHATHMLAGLCWISMPHEQHRMDGMVAAYDDEEDDDDAIIAIVLLDAIWLAGQWL